MRALLAENETLKAALSKSRKEVWIVIQGNGLRGVHDSQVGAEREIADICRPRTQGAAQIRFLRSIGIKVERRADGTPLVWRADVERARASGAGSTFPASNEPAWTRHA